MSLKILVFMLVCLFGIGVSFAESPKENQRLNDVQSQINQTNAKIKAINSKKDSLNIQLKAIEVNYGKLSNSLKEIKQQTKETQQQLKQIRLDNAVETKQLNKQTKGLAGQIRTAYALGQREKLKLLLNQQDPAAFSRTLSYYDYFNKARLKRVNTLKQSVQKLAQLERDEIKQSIQLEELQAKKQQEQQDLKQNKKQRKELLAKLNKDTASQKSRLAQLKKDEKALKKLLIAIEESNKKRAIKLAEKKRLEGLEKLKQQEELLKQQALAKQKTPEIIDNQQQVVAEKVKSKQAPLKELKFAKMRGKLSWPIRGKITQNFGSERIGGTKWDGVLIQAREGTSVRSIASGHVVYADWLRGYGLLIIVNHGKDYMTLYAFNQSLYHKVGDNVKAGDVIAAVGLSGGRKQSGLYFGIRKKRKALNPTRWCGKVSR